MWVNMALADSEQTNHQLAQQAIEEYSSAIELTDRDQRLQAFARAEQLFRQLIATQLDAGQPVTAELSVNLGNSALQAEHLGYAIIAYRQALKADPRHEQARQNLQFARSAVPEMYRTDASNQFVDTLFFWNALLSVQAISLLSGLFFLLAMVCVSLSFVGKTGWWRAAALLPCLLWAVLLASQLARGLSSTRNAVIHAEDTLVYSADSENSALRLSDPLPDGTEVNVLEIRDRWTEIEVAGRTGWVHTSALTELPE